MWCSVVGVVVTLTLGMLAAPLAAQAQQPSGKVYRIGYLATIPPPAHLWEALLDGLRERGYSEERNLVFERRFSEGNAERFAAFAAEMVQLRVDLIIAITTPAALAVKHATTAIPIVMTTAIDPVGAGLVASLARPGGNVTGNTMLYAELSTKRLELLKETLPRLARVAVLHSSATTVGLREYEAAGQTLGVRVQFVEVRDRDDLGRAFTAMVRDRVDALLVPGDTFLFTERQRVAELAREHRLPGIYSWREFTDLGGLMSYSARLTEQFRRAAVYVDKILRGASPATLPVESPSHYELVINLKTAKALGLTIPPALLVRADELIQ